jgi:hypothetical protein
MGVVACPLRGGATSKETWWALEVKLWEDRRCQHAPRKGIHGKVLRDDSLS